MDATTSVPKSIHLSMAFLRPWVQVVGLLFVLQLLSPALSVAAPEAPIQHMASLGRVTAERLLTQIRPGEKLDLDELSLEGEPGPLALELERFEVFAPDAGIEIHDEVGSQRISPPPAAYYHGRIRGRENSVAVLNISERGEASGIVELGDRLWILENLQKRFGLPLELASREIRHDPPPLAAKPFVCGVSQLPAGGRVTPSAGSPLFLENAVAPLVEALPAGQLYQARVAIETDGEFYGLFGSSASTLDYITKLFAYATTIYEREAQTRLVLGDVTLWTNPNTDPWSFGSTSAGLTAFKDYWVANRQGIQRSTAHFLSGKPLGGGIAYIGTLCNNTYGYGLSADLEGNFSINNPQPVWDILVVTHEIGHNFNSPHTHDYQNIGGEANPVDECYVGGPNGPYSPGRLPGLNSLSGGVPGTGVGTIMSYCHLLNPGYSNISMTFGQNHAYGIKAYRVRDVMSNFVAQTALNNASCLPVIGTGSYTLTVAKSGTGSGTVASSPAGINCGSTCSAGFSAGQAVTLTATPASGSVFGGWSGAGCSGTGACNLTMDASKSVTATFAPSPRLINISTREWVGTGDNVMIGGFVIGGTTSKKVVIRALGPSMAPGVAGTLANPSIQLTNVSGTPIASNDDWGTLSASDKSQLSALSLTPSNAAESALVVTLEPNVPYTPIVQGVGGTTGVALVEVYEAQ